MTIFSKIFDPEEKHSASQMGSGGLSVLSTPSLVAFMENAAYHWVKPFCKIQSNRPLAVIFPFNT